jgi:hypothetical protein
MESVNKRLQRSIKPYAEKKANYVLKSFYFTHRFFNAFHISPIPTWQFGIFSPDILAVRAMIV